MVPMYGLALTKLSPANPVNTLGKQATFHKIHTTLELTQK